MFLIVFDCFDNTSYKGILPLFLSANIQEKVWRVPFFLLFVLIPIAEIFVFIKMSGLIGLGTSLLIALVTAMLGGTIVKYQGFQTMINAQEAMKRAQIPSKELFDGLCIVAAGATLITPGFITDALGFALLVPPFREALRRRLSRSGAFNATHFNADYTEFHDNKRYHNPQDPDVIDVEYETIDETKRS